MRIYKVGGCVRDQLMGLEPKDIDYVVVGATTSDMEKMGYEQVGKDFPVFLHPENGCEYALARTERKTGVGYGGFSVDIGNVSLEEDLFRRDLTINAMALDNLGNLIDPYQGKADLDNRILRHVSIHFKEDPVRILRIARFSARYGFDVAEDTLELMKEMVNNGEFNYLTPERVWKEFEKVLPEPYLNKFFETLEKVGALSKVPGFNEVKEREFFSYIRENHPNQVYTMSLLHVFSQMPKEHLKKWKMPAEEQQKISQFSSWKVTNGFYGEMHVEQRIAFIQQNKALHSLEKPEELLYSIVAYQNWKQNQEPSVVWNSAELAKDVAILKKIDYEAVVKNALINKERPDAAVKNAQIELLNSAMKPRKKLI